METNDVLSLQTEYAEEQRPSTQKDSKLHKEHTVANLCFYENEKNKDVEACILVASYEFKFDDVLRRDGNEIDIAKLRNSFEENRKCKFKSLVSPTVEDLLAILSDEEKLKREFNIAEIPSVFFLFILSHGEENNIILTDHKDENDEYILFKTTQVTEAIKQTPNLWKQLNVIFFGACRGQLSDHENPMESKPYPYNNKASSRVTNMPGAQNFVLVYSTVETMMSNRHSENGTWMVQNICLQLDTLREDEPLETFLSKFQNSIHRKLAGKDGQTPEVKYTSHKKLFLRRALNYEISGKKSGDSKSRTEEVVSLERFSYFQWCKENTGLDRFSEIRGRWAVIFSNKTLCPLALRTEEALRENLNFETEILECSTQNLHALHEKIQGEQSYVGCFLAVYFAPLTMDKDDEVCVRIGNKPVKVGDLVYKFFGPANSKWIARPKLFFFVNQMDFSDTILTENAPLKLSGTNHSGSLVCILTAVESAAKLIKLFENKALHGKANILELSLELLREDQDLTGSVIPQISTTLQYLLDFPKWPRIFIEPSFSGIKYNQDVSDVEKDGVMVTNTYWKLINRESQEEREITFKQLKDKFKLKLLNAVNEENAIWILSSHPGTGKSKVLEELKFFFTYTQKEKHIISIRLPEHCLFLKKTQEPTVEGLLKQASEFSLHVDKLLESKKLVVLIDEFDEVCPLFRSKVLRLILKLVELKVPLVVATRPHEEECIKKTIGNIYYKLEINSFNEEQQLELLRQMRMIADKEQNLKILQEIKTFGTAEIIKNPLHLVLCVQFMKNDKEKKIANLYQLYEGVIIEMIEKAVTEKGGIKEKETIAFMEMFDKLESLLQDYAIQTMLNKEDRKWSNDDIRSINKTGLAYIQENYSRFVHKTFAEFLVTKKFITDLDEKSTLDIHIFSKEDFRQCRWFYDCFVPTATTNHLSSLQNYLENVPKKNILTTILDEGLWNILELIEPHVLFEESKRHQAQPQFESEEEKLLSTDRRELINYVNRMTRLGPPKWQEETCEPSQDEMQYRISYYDMLKILCRTNEDMAIRFLRKHANLVRQEEDWFDKLSNLIEIMASQNFSKLFRQLQETFSDVNEALRLTNNSMAFLEAAKSNSINMIELLIESGINVNIQDEVGKTALHLAISERHYDCVLKLLENLASVDVQCHKGLTPLHAAAKHGHAQIMRKLLDSGANHQITDIDSWTPLHTAVRYGKLECVKTLVSYFEEKCNQTNTNNFISEMDSRTRCGMNCIHVGALYGKLEMFKFLIEKAPYLLDSRTNMDMSIVHFAALNENSEILSFIVHLGVDVRSRDKKGWTALHKAAQDGTFETLKILVDFNPDVMRDLTNENVTALHLAVHHADVRLCKYLIENGINVRAVDDLRRNPFHWACEYGRLPTIQYLWRQKCYNMNERIHDGKSALHLAVRRFDGKSVIEWLIKEGADYRSKDIFGRTPIHYAAGGGFFWTLQFLVNLDSAVLKDFSNDKSNVLHFAARHPDSRKCKYLLEKGADYRSKNMDGVAPLHFAARYGTFETFNLLLDMDPTVVHDLTKENDSIIHFAACNGDTKICKFLVTNGIDTLLVQKNGNNALHNASNFGILENVIYLLSLKCYDINSKSMNGKTALHIAAERNYTHIVKLLVKEGADHRSKDNNDWTPLHFAARFGSIDMLRFLVDHDSDACRDLTNYNENALHLAACNKDVQMCKYLNINGSFDAFSVDARQYTALSIAIKFGIVENIEYLTSLNNVDPHGNLCLTDNEDDDATFATLGGPAEVLKNLLRSKHFDINRKNEKGYTPLHYVAKMDHLEATQLLLENGANIDELEWNKSTALMLAARFASVEMCKLLVERGADLTLINEEGYDALCYACVGQKRINVEYLLSLGKFDLERKIKRSFTALFIPVYSGNVGIVKLLLDKGANVNAKNDHQSTPLMISAELSTVEMCQLLVKNGALMYEVDNDGDSALHCAILAGKLENVQYLVQLIEDKTTDAY
ncbi:uncharacterized protein LOC132194090 [Neocloeon triangulifer]|uniref:uncharacterized protein LOC132194090 n=1 Tax=Neocloeon triangulifer TaxID=2078957 RepID=UPI00286EE0F7|nr:uncharacterized protein LOC132194090 [Neocloeon triangulifer]XP_059471145.1 uncharacterized protein LOC132194090 [Neocloeon triangulifer]XP_059471146.1 uncharacterized protein LOC132194090 [Neocloeon triangulifer]XP_059471147.1 uncharacterized protein LOC132194090 [Neocloeon triangulifer]